MNVIRKSLGFLKHEVARHRALASIRASGAMLLKFRRRPFGDFDALNVFDLLNAKARWPYLGDISIFATCATPLDLAGLRNARRIRKMHLAFARLDDADLGALGTLRQVEDLFLAGTELSPESTESISRLSALRTLILMGCKGIKDWRFLAKLHALEVLSVIETDADDDIVTSLRALKSLHAIGLSHTRVSDAGLERLFGANTGFISVGASATLATDESTRVLARQGELRFLSLADTALTDSGLQRLAPLQKLEVLDLARTKVTRSAISDLCRFPVLSTVNLEGTPLDDSGLEELCRAPAIRSVGFSRTHVTSDCASRLGNKHPDVCLMGP